MSKISRSRTASLGATPSAGGTTGKTRLTIVGRLLLVVGAATLAATVLAMGASAATPAAWYPYANGFENAADVGTTDQAMFNVDRVDTGTGGITSASGSHHAVAGVDSGEPFKFTRYGGYSKTFPAGGYTTSADIYLDTAASTGGADLFFDWSSATSNQSGGYGRDFVFNVGTDGHDGFVVSASNNAGGNPANSAHPYPITTSGWYTFQHHFYNSGNGVLAAELTVRPLGAATPLATWTLSDPSDVIGTTVGGNRYGWLLNNELPIALDNVTRSGVCTPTGFVRDGIDLTAAQIGGNVTGTLNATGCDIGVYYAPGTTGASVNAADISGAKYFGVVNDGGNVDVKDSTISKIGNAPFDGTQHGVGIFYTTEQTLNVPSGAASGTISGNTLPSYQKGGITVRGAGASAMVENNTLTGSGMIEYIAQNGIQVSFGAAATVKGNTVSGNWYTPRSNTACGVLYYQAAGVRQQANNLFGNETNLCNAGRGGGNPNP
jgi:hypothetical protein